MMRMEALIAPHDRKNIEIRALNIYTVFFKLGICFLDEIGSLRSAEEGVLAAVPYRAIGMPAIDIRDRLFHIKELRGIIEITVLIVQGKDIAELAAGVSELFHAVPAACLRAGREYIRMAVVIAVLSPAVGVDIELFESRRLERSHLLGALIERGIESRVLSVLIIELGLRLYVRIYLMVQNRAADKILDIFIFVYLLSERL